jgi:hypothetical protein
VEQSWNENWQGKPKYSEKTHPSAAFSTNPIWPDLGSKADRRVGSRRLTAWAMARALSQRIYLPCILHTTTLKMEAYVFFRNV